MAQSAHYHMDDGKLNSVVIIATATPGVTPTAVEQFCLADWPEGQQHQEWLDTASVAEIADWVLAGISLDADEDLDE